MPDGPVFDGRFAVEPRRERVGRRLRALDVGLERVLAYPVEPRREPLRGRRSAARMLAAPNVQRSLPLPTRFVCGLIEQRRNRAQPGADLRRLAASSGNW